jgi:hypothetical protein
MSLLRTSVVLVCLPWLWAAGCKLGAGEECAATDACQSDLECAAVEYQGQTVAVCLPRPETRAEQACVDACTETAAPWPVEARCVSGACRCAPDTFGCSVVSGSDDPGLFLVDPTTCVCRAVREGDPCETNRCPADLECFEGRCRAG